MRTVIGIAGAMGAGKDAIAAHLVKQWGFRRIAFADALKEEVLRIVPRTLVAIHDLNLSGGFGHLIHTETQMAENKCDIQPCLRRMVYETKPKGVRELLQEWGTELRRTEDDDYWVARWWEAVEATTDDIVVPDMRFPNEAQAIRARGGELWKVMRYTSRTSSHISEHALADWPYWTVTIDNKGTLRELSEYVDWLMRNNPEQQAKKES